MDNGKFVNAYIETASAIAHEYLNNVIQLRSQLKIAEDMVVEKDAQINSLSQQLTLATETNELNNKLLSELEELKAQNYSLSNKASQVDTFAKQISEMKKMVISKDAKIEKLSKTTTKKTIPQPPTDDF